MLIYFDFNFLSFNIRNKNKLIFIKLNYQLYLIFITSHAIESKSTSNTYNEINNY